MTVHIATAAPNAPVYVSNATCSVKAGSMTSGGTTVTYPAGSQTYTPWQGTSCPFPPDNPAQPVGTTYGFTKIGETDANGDFTGTSAPQSHVSVVADGGSNGWEDFSFSVGDPEPVIPRDTNLFEFSSLPRPLDFLYGGNALAIPVSVLSAGVPIPISGYDCVSNACTAESSDATYSSLSSCSASCANNGGGTSGYDCVSNACTAVSSSATYSSLSSCSASCANNNGGGGNMSITSVSPNPAITGTELVLSGSFAPSGNTASLTVNANSQLNSSNIAANIVSQSASQITIFLTGVVPGSYGVVVSAPSSAMSPSNEMLFTVTAGSGVVAGACGVSNNKSFSTAPTTDLCSQGTASTVSGTGPWTWTCTGQNGGTTASCSAVNALPLTTSTPTLAVFNNDSSTLTALEQSLASINSLLAGSTNLPSNVLASLQSMVNLLAQILQGLVGSGANSVGSSIGVPSGTPVTSASATSASIDGACGDAVLLGADGGNVTNWVDKYDPNVVDEYDTGPTPLKFCADGSAPVGGAPSQPASGKMVSWTCAGQDGGAPASCYAFGYDASINSNLLCQISTFDQHYYSGMSYEINSDNGAGGAGNFGTGQNVTYQAYNPLPPRTMGGLLGTSTIPSGPDYNNLPQGITTWSAPGGDPSSQVGSSSFTTQYSAPGFYWIPVTNSNTSGTAMCFAYVGNTNLTLTDFHLTDINGNPTTNFAVGEPIYASVTIKNTGSTVVNLNSVITNVFGDTMGIVNANSRYALAGSPGIVFFPGIYTASSSFYAMASYASSLPSQAPAPTSFAPGQSFTFVSAAPNYRASWTMSSSGTYTAQAYVNSNASIEPSGVPTSLPETNYSDNVGSVQYTVGGK